MEKHHQHGQTKLRNVNHIFIYLNGTLSLLQRRSATLEEIVTIATPAKENPYVLMKTVSHLSVTLFELLDALIHAEISLENAREESLQLRQHLLALKMNYASDLPQIGTVLDLTLSVVEQISPASCFMQLRDRYLLEISPYLDELGRQAASCQLQGIEKIISGWLKKYTIDLRSTYSILVGARGPRKNMIEHQYFVDLYLRHGMSQENTLTGGIIFAEMLPQQMNVATSLLIQDLATDLMNQEVGAGMLGSREGMNEDILGKHAKAVLNTFAKGSKKSCPYHANLLAKLSLFAPSRAPSPKTDLLEHIKMGEGLG